MKRRKMRQCLLLSALVGTFMIPGNMLTVKAAENKKAERSLLPVAGIEAVLTECYEENVKENLSLYIVPSKKGEYFNKAFSKVSDHAYVRSEPKETAEWVGKIYADSAATILEYKDGWVKISSGNVEGYVKKEQLYTGEEAAKREIAYRKTEATVTADILNVRKGQSTDTEILTQIKKNEKYTVIGNAVNGWYPIKAGEKTGWVSGEYVKIEQTYSYAESKEEEEERLAEEAEEKFLPEAQSGQAVIDFACQFIGNPYVWGGTSLTDGADCSGFVQSVYQHFGIALPRTTWDMETVGKEVRYEEALPGDLVLYDGHVGLYMGDGNIVNAMNEEQGIGICNASYAPIVTIRRVL